MKDFYFGILAYNQENEIINTLNSIKYQIENYGLDFNNYLIIIDDFSKDNTIEVCNSWLKENSKLFYKIEIVKNKINIGVVQNYNTLLEKINSNYFKVIAGDDLISKNNIYKLSLGLDNFSLLCGIRFAFKNEHLIIEKNVIKQQFFLINSSFAKKILFQLFKFGFIISTPQTLYSRDLYYESNAKEVNKKFKLFEDNPTWYAMFKNCKNFSVNYIEKPIVLYRLSEKSISNSSTELNKRFLAELYNLYQIYIDNGNLFDRVYFKSLMSNGKRKIKFYKIVNKVIFIFYDLYTILHFKKYKKFYERIIEENKIENDYLKNILSKK